MQAEPVTITVRGDDGQLTTRTRTLYRTPFGPLVVVPGLFEWSTEKAYAIRDANADNLRLVDTWLAMSKASIGRATSSRASDATRACRSSTRSPPTPTAPRCTRTCPSCRM